MIRFLNDETVGGYRFGKGAIASFDPAIEAALINQGDAVANHLPVLVSQSYQAVTRSSNNSTDTNFEVMASIPLKGRTINLSGKLVIENDWKYTNSAIVKTLATDFGGQNVSGPTVTTTTRSTHLIAVKNMGSLSSQSVLNAIRYGDATELAMSVNTANDVTIDIKCRWSANVAGENIALLGYSVWYYPGNS